MGTKSLGFRALQLAIVAAALTVAIPAFAQSQPAAMPGIEPPAPVQETVEIYYGARKVSRACPTPPDQAIVQASANGSLKNPDSIPLSEVLHAVCDGIRGVSTATAGFIHMIGEKEKSSAEPRQLIFPNCTMPMAAVPSAQAQPQVVVIREPSESRQAPETATGMNFNIATIFAFSVGFLGLAFSIKTLTARKKEQAGVPVFHSGSAPVPLDPNSVQLMGKYNAGPKPETAEKFEIGPTFHDQIQQKKQAEEANNTAAVELILNQNLALLAALNPEDAGTVVHTDEEGFALPADTHHLTPAIA
jgi:hypothetical protein